jgi:hypothetical protein
VSEGIRELAAMDKEQLIKEVQRLQGLLEQSQSNQGAARQRAPREELSSDIEFIFDVDVLGAKGLNISATGVAFTIEQALPVELRFEHQGQSHHYKARLVRTKSLDTGGFLMGLELRGEVKLTDLPPAPGEDDPMMIL